MLSYQNQFDHPRINRHLIRDFLEQLIASTLHRDSSANSREEYFQHLLQQTDPNSEFERVVLEEIYKRGIKLPDSAQELISQANCKPDFLYKKAKVAIFCDGSVHDRPEQRERDRIKRDDLAWSFGYEVISLRYDEDWRSLLVQLNFLLSQF